MRNTIDTRDSAETELTHLVWYSYPAYAHTKQDIHLALARREVSLRSSSTVGELFGVSNKLRHTGSC